ncbi:MAG TPA: glucosamine-6-phosphate isomerase [Candidatus Hydrogenedentes bacterium]|nr:glucosamine-6-phosphate isomerase [Candidatus Hydrogenedentota bacterium]HOL78060.1 glucosamine-6-phosphate isomerase [Candidatus Hydrogenedentota bacterium]HPO86914.1 glucosamine-6-phosphate isomerase [Candidatus Hydrogenedentota bacterium]
MATNLITTLKGSLLENYFPTGWDLEALDRICSRPPESITHREKWWNKRFEPIPCETLADFDMMLGHEIAIEISRAKHQKKQIIFILPVGPMGMYRWAVYFLKEWNISCSHVHGFNMDEWSDAAGNTLPPKDPGAFQNAMEQAFYGPLGKLTVPKAQRHFATKTALPKYGEQIRALKKKGARLVTVFGIGRACHIAFWEPHFAAEFRSLAEWKSQEYRLGALLHPMTIEQNAITSFKSRTTLVPTRANTIGPGLFLQSDRIIGGADGALGRGMMWQGMSLWATLHHAPTPWIPSTFMPTLPGRLFFLKELAGPLVAECN